MTPGAPWKTPDGGLILSKEARETVRLPPGPGLGDRTLNRFVRFRTAAGDEEGGRHGSINRTQVGLLRPAGLDRRAGRRSIQPEPAVAVQPLPAAHLEPVPEPATRRQPRGQLLFGRRPGPLPARL